MPLEFPVLSTEGFPFKGPTAGREGTTVPFHCFEGDLVLPSMHPPECPDSSYTFAVAGPLPAPLSPYVKLLRFLYPLCYITVHCGHESAGFGRCLPVYVYTPF